MRGRMLHLANGELNSQLYDKDGQVSSIFPFSLTAPVNAYATVHKFH